MHVTLSLILMVFAFALFVIGSWLSPNYPGWPRLISAGLACWAAAVLAGGISLS